MSNYLDNFELNGITIPVRDVEAREELKKLVGSVSGSSGSSSKPIFLNNGTFEECGNVLNVNITGKSKESEQALNADNATEATHALNADNATEATHASSASNATEATRALNADNATEATHALNADKATNADYATASGTASRATEANLATKATRADNANVSAVTKKVQSYDTMAFNGGVSGWGNEQTLYDKNGARVGYVNTYYYGNGKVDVHVGADKGSVIFDTSCYGRISDATTAYIYNHTAVQVPPFIRLTFTHSLGTMYMITGAVTGTVNTSVAYGNSYIGDFVLQIPEAVRCPNGHYSVQVTCMANSKVCFASLNTTTNLTKLQGWVQSNINSSTQVTFYVTIFGY